MDPDRIVAAVRATANTGVDFVKIGVFSEGDACATIKSLRNLTEDGVQAGGCVIRRSAAGLLSHRHPGRRGFHTVMVDTAGKKSGRLTDCLNVNELAAFIARARGRGLLAGLAGSLRAEDVPILLPLGPDVLGFRGALCVGSDRTASMNGDKVRAIRQLMDAGAKASGDKNDETASEAA